MRSFICIITAMLLWSCAQQDPSEMKQNLAGYWEIEKVEFPDGTIKEFRMNGFIDYIEVTGDSGVRKKVAPKLDGSFEVNKAAEKFFLKIENDSLNVYYTTPYNKWKETVLMARDSSMLIINDENKRYHYKKFRSFNTSE